MTCADDLRMIAPSVAEAPAAPHRASRRRLVVLVLAVPVLLLCLAVGILQQGRYFRVEGAAMEPTLKNGDTVVVWKADGLMGHALRRGELIAFRAPTRPDDVMFIKRVIGLPGDSVLIKQGQVIVNSEPLDEPYIQFAATYSYPFNGQPLEVPAANYFVLGDNRPTSADSHLGWFVPKENLIGTVAPSVTRRQQ